MNPAANVVHRGYVEGRVADRDLVEAVGREVLPDAVVGTVRGQVQARSGQADLGSRGLGHERVGHVAGAFADDADHDHDADGGGGAGQRDARGEAAAVTLGERAEPPGEQLRAGAGEQREEQRGGREHAPGHAHSIPAGRVVEQQPIRIAVAGQPEPDREHGADDGAHREADTQSARVEGRGQPDQPEQHDQAASEQHLLVLGVHVCAHAGRQAAPDAVLRGRRQPRGGTCGVRFDFPERALGCRVVVRDLQVRPRLVRGHGADDEDADAGDRDQIARQRRSAGAQPVDRGEHGEHGHQVGELQPEREAKRDLPGRDEPAGDHEAARGAPVAAQQQEQCERDSAGGNHVQVPGLGHAVGRVGEGGAGGGRAELAQPELAGEQIAADEGERPGEEEQQVVPDERRDGARAEEAGRPVAEQRV